MAEAYKKLITTYEQHPVASVLAATSVLGIAWVLNDFREWLAFGTGGTPPNARGYYRMTIQRFQYWSNDVFDPSPLSHDGPSYIRGKLPSRAGSRPSIMPRILPQRQVPERVDPKVEDRLQKLMKTLAADHPELFACRLSHTEGKTTDGLYALEALPTLNPIAKDRLLNHEIAHAHPQDNSLHVWVSDADERKIMEAGWGCRFCLPFVKSGWTMVYAPRNEEEYKVVEQIVKAACAFITGVEI